MDSLESEVSEDNPNPLPEQIALEAVSQKYGVNLGDTTVTWETDVNLKEYAQFNLVSNLELCNN
jgi:hypothetical protein